VPASVAHYYPFIRPGGGPAGYLFNLRLALIGQVSRSLIEVVAAHESSKRSSWLAGAQVQQERGWQAFKRRMMRYRVRRAVTAWRVRSRWGSGRLSDAVRETLAAYPAVVFHDARHAWWYMRQGGVPRGQQVFVMPHSPVDAAAEEVYWLRAEYGGQYDWSRLRESLRRLEVRTYRRAQGIIVPVRDAVEAYFDGSPTLREQFRSLTFHEIPSGVEVVITKTPPDEVRARLGVTERQVLVGFFGRYDELKGFDRFLDVVRAAHARHPGRFAFISGGAGWLKPQSLPGYRDLGWLAEDLGDYVNAADVIMAPNRYTLFDLGILEAMSLGKVVLTSPTGGNRWLSTFTPGVVLADVSDPGATLDALVDLTKLGKIRLLGRRNGEVYLAQFNLDAFVRRHLDFATHVLAAARA
jgi:glycosyltransferase involved in cell wall biosynthesis